MSNQIFPITLFFLCILQLIQISVYSQDVKQNYQIEINKCSFDTIHKNLQEFEKLGIKEMNTNALKKTCNWLENKYISYGYQLIERDTFMYSGNFSTNLIITKIGNLFPDSFLIICGHYDTKNGPGVGDNGSGTAIILEIARILKNIKTDISIRFIHFSGEEDGLIGSYHYVNERIEKERPKIKLVFNIDAVGGVANKTNDRVVCESDKNNNPSTNNYKSNEYTKLLASNMEKYSNLKAVFKSTYASDYMPFQYKGYVITGLYEFNQSPYAHTSRDIIENVDVNYIFQMAKGALGASLSFANGDK